MKNLEIMEQATKYTTEIYKQVYYPTKVQSGAITYEGLKYYANCYSGECLRDTILSETGICGAYPIRGKENLREKMASIGKEALVNEVLKNVVNVVTYLRLKQESMAENMESSFSKNLSIEQKVVVLFNNLNYFGPEKAYLLMEDPDILYSACVTFAKYRSDEFKDKMEYVSTMDPEAQYLNSKLQKYYELNSAEKLKELK